MAIVSLNLGEMRDQVRFLVREPTSDQFTDAQINQQLNLGQLDAANRSEWLKSSWKLTSVAAQRTYIYPSDCLEVKRIKYANKWLSPTSHDKLDFEHTHQDDETWITDTGTPTHWYSDKEEVFGLFPIPTATTTGVMWLWGVQVPDKLTSDSATSILPAFLHEAICLFAASKCKFQDREREAAHDLWVQYMSVVGDAKKAAEDRDIEGPINLVTNEHYYPFDYKNNY